jgi:FdhD protein
MKSVVEVPVRRINGAGLERAELDALAVEEPLEIRLDVEIDGRRVMRTVSVTMRTPGDDFDLAVGFLFTEGIVARAEDITSIRHCGLVTGDASYENSVCVEIRAGVDVDFARLERHVYTSSSCGVCGKTSLDAVLTRSAHAISRGVPRLEAKVVHTMPARLRGKQVAFSRTGGLHAAALFDGDGALLAYREDVGRHNAVDKLLGAELREGRVPLEGRALFLSGRASFELVQKARMAGIAFVAAVGAPSSLAVELADASSMTLLGFVRNGRFNVYAGEERLA